MTANETPATPGSDREIVITRVFDAPRALVYEAWTDPEHVAHWWGPKGIKTTVIETDLRPGGRWEYVMRFPDGTEYPVKGVFREVEPPARLVISDGYDEDPEESKPFGDMVTTVTFDDLGDKTRVTMRILHESAENRKKYEDGGAVGGWNSSFERLEEYLAAA